MEGCLTEVIIFDDTRMNTVHTERKIIACVPLQKNPAMQKMMKMMCKARRVMKAVSISKMMTR